MNQICRCDCEPDRPSTGPVLPEGPLDPSYGIPLPPIIDNGLPGFPPMASTGPIRPTFPTDPGYGLPLLPGVWPHPPVFVDNGLPVPPHPPLVPSHPIHTIPPVVDNDLPGGAVWPPLHPSFPDKIIAVVWIVGVGYRWAVLNTAVQLPIWEPPGS